MKIKCGELFWDAELGLGYVTFTRAFGKDDPVTCLDAIHDWMHVFTYEYEDHLKRSRKKFRELRRKAKRVNDKKERQ